MQRVLTITALMLGMLTNAGLADDFLEKVRKSLPNDAVILGSPKTVPAGGTRIFYVHIEKPQADTFTLTCSLMRSGGWYCSRGAAATPNPMPFVVDAK